MLSFEIRLVVRLASYYYSIKPISLKKGFRLRLLSVKQDSVQAQVARVMPKALARREAPPARWASPSRPKHKLNPASWTPLNLNLFINQLTYKCARAQPMPKSNLVCLHRCHVGTKNGKRERGQLLTTERYAAIVG